MQGKRVQHAGVLREGDEGDPSHLARLFVLRDSDLSECCACDITGTRKGNEKSTVDNNEGRVEAGRILALYTK